ncbi:MAG: hypothetical protein L7F78_26970 [Syntrophales bacterium LBB04]|nr:hypothetical protein [Syntrophales bacterium LBB04]
MTPRLNQSTKIWTLAKDLGIRTVNDPVSAILMEDEQIEQVIVVFVSILHKRKNKRGDQH